MFTFLSGKPLVGQINANQGKNEVAPKRKSRRKNDDVRVKAAPKKKVSAPEEGKEVLAPQSKVAPKKKASAPEEGEKVLAPKRKAAPKKKVSTGESVPAPTVMKRPSASMASEENETVEPSATNNDSVNEALVGTDNDEADCHTGNDDDDNADGHDQQIDGSGSRTEFFVMRYVGRKTAAVRSRIRACRFSALGAPCASTPECVSYHTIISKEFNSILILNYHLAEGPLSIYMVRRG